MFETIQNLPFLKSRNFRIAVIAGLIMLTALCFINAYKIRNIKKTLSSPASPEDKKIIDHQEAESNLEKREPNIKHKAETVEFASEEEIESVIKEIEEKQELN